MTILEVCCRKQNVEERDKMPALIDVHEKEILRALDADLPFLSSRAAIELDNVVLGRPTELSSVKALVRRLSNSFEPIHETATPRSLMDPATLTVVSRAISGSQWTSKLTTVDQLVTEAWNLTSSMKKSSEDRTSTPEKQVLERMRDFCVALSKCAASYRKTIHAARPVHRYRR